MNNLRFREAEVKDVSFMTLMLLEAAAASFNAIERLSDHSEMYIKDWPQPYEVGVIAETEAGEAIGAAWIRIFPNPVHFLGVHHLNSVAIKLYQHQGWTVDGEINEGEYIMMSRFI